MSTEQPPSAYEIVLADLKAKRAQIDQAIAAIESLLASGGTAATGVATTATPEAKPLVVTPGLFHGHTIADAARKVLDMHKKELTTKEILDSIVLGGVRLATATPLNTVQTVLGRQQDIIKVKRGTWALASWHPNAARFKKGKSSADDGEGSKNDEPAAEKGGAESKPKVKTLGQSASLKVVH
ncbi:MAG: winged helix-turn-helix domain-containing protein [Alphaproteobacteria bacterium]